MHRMGKPVLSGYLKSESTAPGKLGEQGSVKMSGSCNFSAPNLSADTPVPAKPTGRDPLVQGVVMKPPKFEI